MKKMMEFQISLDGSEEDRARAKETGKIDSFDVIMHLPADALIRRINTRILQTKKTGVHPETKQIGTFIIPEEVVYMWAECDDDALTVTRKFRVIGAGAEIPNLPGDVMVPYVGTFLLQAGAMVFHMYGPIYDKE